VAITSYTVNYQDRGTDGAAEGAEIQSPSSPPVTNAAVVAEAITGGHVYRITIEANNLYGPGLASAALDVLAAQYPPQMNAPRLSYQNTYVKIEWDAPETYDTNFSPILMYEVLLKTGPAEGEADSTTFVEVVGLCDGAN
jgi:hypothetical protein